LHGTEIWVSEEGPEETDVTQRRFYKKVLGTPRFAANAVIELEMGRDSRRGQGVVFGCEVLAKGFAVDQGITSKRVL
jgi:hypothetical protein